MRALLNSLVATPIGAFVVLLIAATLEVMGDACFQTGMYRSAGNTRIGWMLAGVAVLGGYGLFVNLPPWDFGRLLGVYVALFFVMAQAVAWLRFGQTPTMPIVLGGVLIVAGGLVITFLEK